MATLTDYELSTRLPVPGVDYPKPFLNINKYYNIKNIKELFDLCSYMYYNNEILANGIYGLSEYPVTRIVIESDTDSITEEYVNEKLKALLIELGLDYFTYGNAFLFHTTPFDNYIHCPACRSDILVSRAKGDKENQHFKIQNKKIVFVCPKCKQKSKTDKIFSKPQAKIDVEDLILIRLNPMFMDIKANIYTGAEKYEITVDKRLKRSILAGERFHLETTPATFIKAVLQEKKVELRKDRVCHLKREGLSDSFPEWGKPLIYSVLKTAYHFTLLQRSQFSICSQLIVPMNIIFPRDVANHLHNAVPLNMLNARIKHEVYKWRRSHSYIPIFPIPVDQITVGGQGRSLFLAPELESLMKRMIIGMGVPQEFVYGGLQWTGSSVSLRMLENRFYRYREKLGTVLNVIAKMIRIHVLKFDKSRKFKLKMVPLRSGDDTQRKAQYMNLASAGVLSKQTLLNEFDDIDYMEELNKIKGEREKENELGIMTNIMNLKVNAMMQDYEKPSMKYHSGIEYPLYTGTEGSSMSEAMKELEYFLQQDPNNQEVIIQNLSQINPDLASLLMTIAQKGSYDDNDVMNYTTLKKKIPGGQEGADAQTREVTTTTQQTQIPQQGLAPSKVPKQQMGAGNPDAMKGGTPKTEGRL